jgi:hypothetical protein
MTGFHFDLFQFLMITASDPIPTVIPTRSDAIRNHASISGNRDMPMDVAVARTPAIPALSE